MLAGDMSSIRSKLAVPVAVKRAGTSSAGRRMLASLTVIAGLAMAIGCSGGGDSDKSDDGGAGGSGNAGTTGGTGPNAGSGGSAGLGGVSGSASGGSAGLGGVSGSTSGGVGGASGSGGTSAGSAGASGSTGSTWTCTEDDALCYCDGEDPGGTRPFRSCAKAWSCCVTWPDSWCTCQNLSEADCRAYLDTGPGTLSRQATCP
jgi:hypothetical protein